MWLAVFWGCDDTAAAGGAAGPAEPDACATAPLVRRWLGHYARVHFGSALESAGVVEGIYGLEQNWVCHPEVPPQQALATPPCGYTGSVCARDCLFFPVFPRKSAL